MVHIGWHPRIRDTRTGRPALGAAIAGILVVACAGPGQVTTPAPSSAGAAPSSPAAAESASGQPAGSAVATGPNCGTDPVKLNAYFETGFDLGLWQDKADLGMTWYRAVSSDVILNLPVAGSTGYTQKPANAAELRNAAGL